MIFINDTKIYATVWEVKPLSKPESKFIELRITTGEKKQDGTWITSTWWPRVIGHAFNSLKDVVKAGDKLVITKAKLANENYKDKDGNLKCSFGMIILEASIEGNINDSTASAATTAQEKPKTAPPAAKEELCW